MCACPRACAYAKIGGTVSVPLTKGTGPFVRKESFAAFQIVSINVADRLATSWDPSGLQVQSYQLLFTGGWF